MSRRLTKNERDDWDRVRRSVRALRPEAEAKAEGDGTARRAAVTPAKRTKTEPAQPALRPTPTQPPLALLEERARRRVARGLVEVEARSDQPGRRQERAFAALFAFLRRSQLRGAKLVLVITGKGGGEGEGRGVLRHSVPAWLARADVRELVVGFEEAARRHGGTGALYVRIRRKRDAREKPGG